MDSKKIISLLKERHHEDVFIEECYCNAYGTFRMDAWCMAGYWSKRRAIGYEIKVSRSDFVNDNKWRNYLDCCNEFYFVCPFGLIQPEEIPFDVGLCWVSKTETMIKIKRKAPHRPAIIPEGLWFQIIKNRMSVIKNSMFKKQDYWKAWLKEREINSEFGRQVSESIRKTVREKIETVQMENAKFRALLEKERYTLAKLKESGIDLEKLSHWNFEAVLNEKINQVNCALPKGLEHALLMAENNMKTIRELLLKPAEGKPL